LSDLIGLPGARMLKVELKPSIIALDLHFFTAGTSDDDFLNPATVRNGLHRGFSLML
jgi:hypothetical protein